MQRALVLPWVSTIWFIPAKKAEIINEAEAEVAEIQEQFPVWSWSTAGETLQQSYRYLGSGQRPRIPRDDGKTCRPKTVINRDGEEEQQVSFKQHLHDGRLRCAWFLRHRFVSWLVCVV
jgi:hypothetical protein